MRKNMRIFSFLTIIILAIHFNVFAEEESGESKESIKEQESQEEPPQSQGGSPETLMSGPVFFEDKFLGSNEQLKVDPQSGTVSLAVPIQVPRGRSGLEPSINLSYNSSASNGPLGMGWSLEFGKASHFVQVS